MDAINLSIAILKHLRRFINQCFVLLQYQVVCWLLKEDEDCFIHFCFDWDLMIKYFTHFRFTRYFINSDSLVSFIGLIRREKVNSLGHFWRLYADSAGLDSSELRGWRIFRGPSERTNLNSRIFLGLSYLLNWQGPRMIQSRKPCRKWFLTSPQI